MPTDEGGSLARKLAGELASCRRRGVDRLGLSSHNQNRLALPELEDLANRHCALDPTAPHERYAKIRRLLRSALGAMQAEDPSDADLIRSVIFGDSPDRVSAPAKELFEQAMRKYRAQNAKRFHEDIDQAMLHLGFFLPEFVRLEENAKPAAQPPAAASDHPLPTNHPLDDEVGTDADAEPGTVLIGPVNQRQRFIDLLARADRVTIIGSTNENLAQSLERALERKRELHHDRSAFWRQIRVVFLADLLLPHLSDERPAAPDRNELNRQRQIAATHGRRSVSAFMRRNSDDNWQIYESPAFPPVGGTLFEMPGGQQLVHLLIRRPEASASDHMYVEFADTSDHYFSGVFEDVLRRCISDNKTVPIGVPRDGTFHVQRSRYRNRVLLAGSGADGWVPQVLIITWQRKESGAEPLLQFRRLGIAAKVHLDTLSHPVGTMLESDLAAPGPQPGGRPGTTGRVIRLPDRAPAEAAMRRLRIETGEDPPRALRPLYTCGYLNHDKEHQYYFVFACEFPDEYQFPGRSEIYRVPLPELESIRKHQALRRAALLCGKATPLPVRIRAEAFEIAALNLLLHGHAKLAGRVAELGTRPRRGPDLAEVAAELARLEEITRPRPWVSGGQDVELRGLAGFEYREFFSRLLPVYADIGVAEANRLLAEINDDVDCREAVGRLAALYHSQTVIPHIRLEL